MTSLRKRIIFRSDGPVVGRSEMPGDQIIQRLEQGETWDTVVSELKIEPIDVIAALAADALGDDDSLGLPLVHSHASRPALLTAFSESAIRSVSSRSDRGTRLALAAGLLQIYDLWDASHNAAQAADDLGERVFSSYWHAIAHRREPDPGNAAYWFRRVGPSPLLERLSQATQPILETEPGQKILDRSGRWNTTEMIDLCSHTRAGSKEEALARRLQRVEMLTLLNANVEATGLGES